MFLGKLDKHIWKPKKKGSGLKLQGGNLLKILKIFEESGKIKILMKILHGILIKILQNHIRKSQYATF